MYIEISKSTILSLTAALAIVCSFYIIFAYGTTNPQKFGHTWSEIECDNNFCVNTTSESVGIGTTTPSKKLEIVGNITIAGNITFESSTLRYLYLGSGGGYIRTGNPSTDWIHLEANNSPGVAINWFSYTKPVIFNSSIGIGVMTPTEKLDVAGAIKIGNTNSPCDASHRGVIKFVQGGSGVADHLQVCEKDASDKYGWVYIASVAGGFKYRKPITITNSGSSDLTNYQISITLDTASLISAGKMRSDCDDIRFVDSDRVTNLNYWIESGCNTASTKIWVKVPSIPRGSKIIYVYYGKPDAVSESNGDATFDFFDDFLGTNLNTGKWYVSSGTSYTISNSILKITQGAIGLQNALGFNINDGYLVEAKVRYESPETENHYGGFLNVGSSRFSTTYNDAMIEYGLDKDSDLMKIFCIASGTNFYCDIVGWYPVYVFTISLNTWYIIGTEVTSSTAAAWYNYGRSQLWEGISWGKNIKYVSIGAYSGEGTYDIRDTSYDWVRIRKYSPSLQLSINIGTEE
jgi:hypothetical protein